MVHSFTQSSMNVRKIKKNQLETIHIQFIKESLQLPQLLPTSSHCSAGLVRSGLMAAWLQSSLLWLCSFMIFYILSWPAIRPEIFAAASPQLHPCAGCLGLALLLLWDSVLRGGFMLCFSGACAGAGRWAIILWCF